MDLNLDALKNEILAHLDNSEFAVFHSIAHGFEELPIILWDVKQYPDYRTYLEVARKAGVRVVLVGIEEFQASELDELEEQLEISDLPRDEQRELASRIRELRRHEGRVCTLELAFDYNSRLYVFELQPEWYDEFVALEDEIMSFISDDDDEDEDSLGGYFSKN